MKEQLSVIDQATEIVIKKEDKYLRDLYVWNDSAKEHAAGCACGRCQGSLERSEKAIYKEETRLGIVPEFDPDDEPTQPIKTIPDINSYYAPDNSEFDDQWPGHEINGPEVGWE